MNNITMTMENPPQDGNFPIRILLVRTGEKRIVNLPQEIPKGMPFKVLATRRELMRESK